MVVCKTKPTLNCFSYNCLQKQLSSLRSSNTAFAKMAVGFVCLFLSLFLLLLRLSGQNHAIRKPLYEALNSVATCFITVLTLEAMLLSENGFICIYKYQHR